MKTQILVVLTLICCFTFSNAQVKHEFSEVGTENRFTKVKPPSLFLDRLALGKTQTSIINMTYIGNWEQQAKDAADYAAFIWSFLINSDRQIKIKLELKELGSGALAETWADEYKENFPNAPFSNVKYPIALAEAIADQELNDAEDYEININVNSEQTDWYYGLDGNTPEDKVDFVSVILHEITHGLGFSSSFSYSSGIGSWGIDGYPYIYDQFPVFGSISSTTYKLINTTSYPNPSSDLGDALTSNNIFFDGTKTKLMNNDNLPKLYAPYVWAGGSSISHFDEEYYPPGNSNSLMSYKIDLAEAIHSPGEVCLALLEDLGWEINRLITILEPEGGLVYQPGTSPAIKWTDNKYGGISIDLYKKDQVGVYQYHSHITAFVSQPGTMNEYNDWIVPSDNGTFKIRTLDLGTGEGYGDSDQFIISNLPMVATPVITPAGGLYYPPQTISLWCATGDAKIYYTLDGTEPSQSPLNGTLYNNNPFEISTNMVINAKAFKTGYSESALATEEYIFYGQQDVATVIPVSGTYRKPQVITIASWPNGNFECWYTQSWDNNEPPDPQNAGNPTLIPSYPASIWIFDVTLYKIKVQLKKDGV
jgi:hypothetical protein